MPTRLMNGFHRRLLRYRVERIRDKSTGEIYHVLCRDGVNGGKGAYSDVDEAWMETCYRAIKDRTKREAAQGVAKIGISSNEWTIMKSRIHASWLDKEADRSIDEGLIGTHEGIPVIVDSKKEDDLPKRRSR